MIPVSSHVPDLFYVECGSNAWKQDGGNRFFESLDFLGGVMLHLLPLGSLPDSVEILVPGQLASLAEEAPSTSTISCAGQPQTSALILAAPEADLADSEEPTMVEEKSVSAGSLVWFALLSDWALAVGISVNIADVVAAASAPLR